VLMLPPIALPKQRLSGVRSVTTEDAARVADERDRKSPDPRVS
jgi:hypothetical protein